MDTPGASTASTPPYPVHRLHASAIDTRQLQTAFITGFLLVCSPCPLTFRDIRPPPPPLSLTPEAPPRPLPRWCV
jgi:hypothetical protein